mmetsp:Transcript_23892/g.34948  ORF Transcript_23892/g.34948 Transcript_23892/m.34948 type:complete len:308 (-) Transcript_23892:261-1184(-)|eukprot:CAMPEP_0195522104 /NCGR_PEP_ID=MMETSP0794_2-20130614/20049_1 /TAXON_ID=515487 /ORGANISM="Stephanopyxis turris, Strain CCMP 815" /LENGTH=307 /DNA_ID=CAMNT_0040651793 /DNA_START=98 /DNA_END=1021 /DNA_ORIENTATION=-
MSRSKDGSDNKEIINETEEGYNADRLMSMYENLTAPKDKKEENDDDKHLHNLFPEDLPSGWRMTSDFKERLEESKRKHQWEKVDYIRSDGTMKKKSRGWCIEKGYEEVREGLWAGSWFDDMEEEKRPGPRTIEKGTKPPRGNWELSGLMGEEDPDTFQSIVEFKMEANSAFAGRQYEDACGLYDKALKLCLSPEKACVMPCDQLEEKMKIHSNKAECLLRLKKYEDAARAANEALLLDSSNDKSRFRRGKATFMAAEKVHDAFGLGHARDDLDIIVKNESEGMEDAKKWIAKIMAVEKRDFLYQNTC